MVTKKGEHGRWQPQRRWQNGRPLETSNDILERWSACTMYVDKNQRDCYWYHQCRLISFIIQLKYLADLACNSQDMAWSKIKGKPLYWQEVFVVSTMAIWLEERFWSKRPTVIMNGQSIERCWRILIKGTKKLQGVGLGFEIIEWLKNFSERH